jgi:hypothetical protein
MKNYDVLASADCDEIEPEFFESNSDEHSRSLCTYGG